MTIEIGRVVSVCPEKGICDVVLLFSPDRLYRDVPLLQNSILGPNEMFSSSLKEKINKSFYDDRGIDVRFVSEGEYNRITPGSFVVLLFDDNDNPLVLGTLPLSALQSYVGLLGKGKIDKPSIKEFVKGIYNRFSWNLPTLKKHWFGNPRKEELYKESRPFFTAARDAFWFVRRKAKVMFVSLYKIFAEILRISKIYTLPAEIEEVENVYNGKLLNKGKYEEKALSEAMISLDADGRIFIGSEYSQSSADLQSNNELKAGLGTYVVLNDFVTEVSGKKFLLERGEHVNVKGEARILLESQKEKVPLEGSKFDPNASGLIASKSPYFVAEFVDGNMEGLKKMIIKVGRSSITLTPEKITIESPAIELKSNNITANGEPII